MQGDFVEAGGTHLFVRGWGEKGRPAVFYWHGGGGGSSEWPHIAPALEAAGYRRIEEFLSVIPNTQVVRVRAGHGTLQDAGEEVRRALLGWLAENEL